MLAILVLTISDRASAGVYEDLSGPAIEQELKKHLPDATITRKIVADEADAIIRAFDEGKEADFILTTGGTGIGLDCL